MPSSMPAEPSAPRHIRLTSHASLHGALPIQWGAGTPVERGPVVGTTSSRAHRNVIGTHSGSYGIYRALAVAAGSLRKAHRADLTDTMPTDAIGPHPSWFDPEKIVSLDPFGATVADVFRDQIDAGLPVASGAFRVAQIGLDGRRQRRAVAGRHHGARHSGLDELGEGACIACHHRRARRHRFERGEAEALVP